MMSEFSYDERMLMMLYSPGTRTGLIEELKNMSTYLTEYEVELRNLTDHVLEKLDVLSDEEFDEMPLYPD